jgi:hypothetical protein
MKQTNAEAKFGQKGKCYLIPMSIKERPEASEMLGRNPSLQEFYRYMLEKNMLRKATSATVKIIEDRK